MAEPVLTKEGQEIFNEILSNQAPIVNKRKKEKYFRFRMEDGAGADASPDAVGAAIREDVARFTAGAPASDDLTIVIVTWRGGASKISGR